jgi:hypothetical protein
MNFNIEKLAHVMCIYACMYECMYECRYCATGSIGDEKADSFYGRNPCMHTSVIGHVRIHTLIYVCVCVCVHGRLFRNNTVYSTRAGLVLRT